MLKTIKIKDFFLEKKKFLLEGYVAAFAFFYLVGVLQSIGLLIISLGIYDAVNKIFIEKEVTDINAIRFLGRNILNNFCIIIVIYILNIIIFKGLNLGIEPFSFGVLYVLLKSHMKLLNIKWGFYLKKV